MDETGFVIWLTGMPAVGKTTIARALDTVLRSSGLRHVEVLDGDEIRATFSADLGFSRADRDANVRRVGEVARLLARNDVAVIVALISPYEETRTEVRGSLPRCVLVHLDSAPEELIRRDPKGHYRRAMQGGLHDFTGVSDPYEPPREPDLHLRTDVLSIGETVDRILDHVRARGYLPGCH